MGRSRFGYRLTDPDDAERHLKRLAHRSGIRLVMDAVIRGLTFGMAILIIGRILNKSQEPVGAALQHSAVMAAVFAVVMYIFALTEQKLAQTKLEKHHAKKAQ